MLLEDTVAVVYGAGGQIGGAVAQAFARGGARVFLAGRTQSTLEAVADEILPAEEIAAGVVELIEDDSRAGAMMRVTVRDGRGYVST